MPKMTGIRHCPRCIGGRMILEVAETAYVCVNCGHRKTDFESALFLEVVRRYKAVRSQAAVAQQMGIPARTVYEYVRQERRQQESVSGRSR
jgi:uncharacterized protein (DUF983 family)